MDELQSDCDPIVKNEDLGLTLAADKTTTLDPLGPANPCGLVAKSLFNDTFYLYQDQTFIYLKETGIAWESDIKYKFKNLQQPHDGFGWDHWQWTDVENGKLYGNKIYFRAFYCVDEDSRIAKFQEAVWQIRVGHSTRKRQHVDYK